MEKKETKKTTPEKRSERIANRLRGGDPTRTKRNEEEEAEGRRLKGREREREEEKRRRRRGKGKENSRYASENGGEEKKKKVIGRTG